MALTDKDKELLARMKTPLAPRKGDWDLAAALIERLANECKEAQGKALREAVVIIGRHKRYWEDAQSEILDLIGGASQ